MVTQVRKLKSAQQSARIRRTLEPGGCEERPVDMSNEMSTANLSSTGVVAAGCTAADEPAE
jgi:hypothetical protein